MNVKSLHTPKARSLFICVTWLLGLNLTPNAAAQTSGNGGIGLLPFGSEPKPNIWIDNDDTSDTYIELLGFAAAASGKIFLHGMSSTTSVQPFNPYVSSPLADTFGHDRLAEYNDAVNSGMDRARLPVPSSIYKGHFARPASGNIEDTKPLRMPAATELVSAINAFASPASPMIICAGGQLSVVADAYMQDPSIADKVVVSFIGDTTNAFLGYNEKSDPWATFIVCSRLTIASFPAGTSYRAIAPVVTKQRIVDDMPSSPIQSRALAKNHPSNPLPDDRDADGLALTAVIDRQNYVTGVTRMSVTGRTAEGLPTVSPNPNGNIYMVNSVNQAAGTEIWWSVVADAPVYLGEGGFTLTPVAKDDFNRSNSGNLGPGWEKVGSATAGKTVTSSQAASASGSANVKRTDAYANNQFAQVVFSTPPSRGNYPGIATRFSNSGDQIRGYQLFANENRDLTLQKYVAGAPRLEILKGMPAPFAGQTVRLVSNGDTHSVWLSSGDANHPLNVDGFELVGVVRDNAVASGTTAISSYYTTSGAMDNWVSGNVTLRD